MGADGFLGYCRECVDAGKANVAIPQLPPRGSQSSYNFTPYTPPVTSTTPAPVTAVPVASTPQSVSGSTGPTPSPVISAAPQSQPTAQAGVSPASENTDNA